MKITLKELEALVKAERPVKIETPTGYELITNTYRKTDEGFLLGFNDGSIIKCASKHLMMQDDKWKPAISFEVGDEIAGKVITQKVSLPVQEWVDFSIDAEHESYLFNGILHHNSGKSLICYMIVRYLLENTDLKILITVPTTSLVEQLYSDFDDYASETDWVVGEWCHRVYSGKEKNTNHRVLISTWQSIYNLPATWFNRFGAYICDEAHGADSKSITGIIDKLPHAPIRIGMTGTLDGSKLHELEMLARFGPLIRVITTAELMASGDIANLKIRCLRLKYSKLDIDYVKNLKYQAEIDFLVSNKQRNNILVREALSQPKNTLILFNYIDKHGTLLYDMLKSGAESAGKKIYYIYGDVAVVEREKIRQILEKENNAILLASMGTFSTGISVKNIHTVIFCHPYKAKIKNLQAIGRGLRAMAGKDGVTLIDIADDLATKKKPNAAMRHFLERLKIYQEEKFSYDIEVIQLE